MIIPSLVFPAASFPFSLLGRLVEHLNTDQEIKGSILSTGRIWRRKQYLIILPVNYTFLYLFLSLSATFYKSCACMFSLSLIPKPIISFPSFFLSLFSCSFSLSLSFYPLFVCFFLSVFSLCLSNFLFSLYLSSPLTFPMLSFLFLSMSNKISVSLSVYSSLSFVELLSLSLSLSFIHFLFLCLSISVSLSFHLSLSLSFCLYVSLSLSLSL